MKYDFGALSDDGGDLGSEDQFPLQIVMMLELMIIVLLNSRRNII